MGALAARQLDGCCPGHAELLVSGHLLDLQVVNVNKAAELCYGLKLPVHCSCSPTDSSAVNGSAKNGGCGGMP